MSESEMSRDWDQRISTEAVNSFRDRFDLRADLQESNDSFPNQKAFLLGRFCNELRFSMQAGWCGVHHCARHPNEISGRALSLLSTLPSSNELARLATYIENCHSDWQLLFGQEYQVDEFDHLRASYNSNETTSEQINNLLFGRSQDLLNVLPAISTIAPALGGEYKHFLRVGFLTDQVINPPFLYDAIRIIRNNNGADDAGTSATTNSGAVETNLALAVGSGWASGTLWPQIEAALTQIQTDCSQRENSISFFETDDFASRLLDHVSVIVRGERPNGNKATRLELQVLENPKKIVREGFANHAKLSPLEFLIINYLLDAEDNPITMAQLQSRWAEWTGNPGEPTLNAVRKARTGLNSELALLGLKVETAGSRKDWVLVELPSST